ncbi:alpha/beta fold hydrolase [Blastococcus sp. Marseille-P5729]|uniref:alpha/beta fold hydrolase n=1 Tax=Blastococcus sp. Marseille-P5729 TaxID=2086582 RepID=UPI000D0F2CA9|nr:alpha/beta fold hydrolase [Blastococcus sp. Marseille-P5729]
MPENLIDYRTRTEPWPGRFHRLTVQTPRGERVATLHARHTDGPDDAPVLLHVHGLGGSASNWTDLATSLRGRFRSIALDLPGWGLSDPAPDGDYSIAAAARWVSAAIEALVPSQRVHLVGNSLGGLISIRVAAQRPEQVATLSLVSPAVPGFEATTDADPRMALLALPYIGSRIQQRINDVDFLSRARMSAELCFADPESIPEYRLEQQAEEIAARAGFPWAVPAFSGSLRSIVAVHLHRKKDNPWRLAAGLPMPTAVIWGDKDRLVPVKRAPKLAGVIPDARLHVFENVGHTAQLEVPEATAEAVLSLVNESERDNASAA